MVNAVERIFKVRRGDYEPGETYRFKRTGDASMWANAVVRCQLRPLGNGPVVHTFNLNPTVTVEGGYAVLTVRTLLSDEDSGKLNPGRYFADIEVKSDNFPKATLVKQTYDIEADVTR